MRVWPEGPPLMYVLSTYRRMNFALIIKLMTKITPVNRLPVIEKWFAISVTCVMLGYRK